MYLVGRITLDRGGTELTQSQHSLFVNEAKRLFAELARGGIVLYS